MKFDVMTLFPDMMESILSSSIIGRARKAGIIDIGVYNIRDFTKDKHRKTDEEPYGGGYGMIMTCQPIHDTFKAICENRKTKPYCIYMSPQGKVLTQAHAKELSQKENICILCGHYEGVDQRILDLIVDEEISTGDYVLTGGELPCAILIDCVSRLIDGVLPAKECHECDSISCGMLEHPQYTRPEVYEGLPVPDVLLSGHHKNIEKWKHDMSVEVTKKKRPELLDEE